VVLPCQYHTGCTIMPCVILLVVTFFTFEFDFDFDFLTLLTRALRDCIFCIRTMFEAIFASLEIYHQDLCNEVLFEII
jgi:hypothetical protein